MEGFNDEILSKKEALKTDENLNMRGYRNIFVGGDVTDLPEEKTAQNAEKHGGIISENIKRSIDNKPLFSYEPEKIPLLISLGESDGILTYGSLVIPGYISATVKKLVRFWVLKKYIGSKKLLDNYI